MPARRRTLLPLLATLVAIGAGAGAAPAAAVGVANSTPDTGAWTTGGTANDVVRAGDRVYVGGDFDSVGPRTGPFAAIDADSGAVEPGLPYVDGTTNATIPDGDGGWYVGGDFERIDGVARDGLAHVTASGAVDASFAPQLDGAVTALALAPDGETLYAGGRFDAVGGDERPAAAALDADNGALDPDWDAQLASDATVLAIAADATAVYLGGSFAGAGGQVRKNLAALDPDDGSATTWDPSPDNDVTALALADDTLYVGGLFTAIDGQSLGYAVSFDLSGPGPVLDAGFAPQPDNFVRSIAIGDDAVYLAGEFGIVDGQTRQGVAAVDPVTGDVDAWDALLANPSNPDMPAVARAVAVAGDRVYVGGTFTSVQNDLRTNLAQFSAADGSLADWDPIAGRGIRTLAADADGVVTGGALTTIGGERRANLAAFDADDGSVTDWDPQADRFVSTLAAGPDGTVYASGLFSTIGGQPHSLVAAIDPQSGQPRDWDPQVGSFASAMTATADAVYLSGEFGTVGGEPRDKLAAVSPTTGAVLPFRADLDGSAASSLAVHGSTLYLAAPDIARVGGVERRTAAALDATTGAVLPWNPFGAAPRTGATGFTRLAIEGDRLVGVGAFRQVFDGGVPHDRGRVAVYDLSGPMPVLTPVDANADDEVRHVAIHGGAVYVTGDFGALGGQARDGAGAFDVATGTPLSWAPEVLAAQRLSAAGDGTVYATGEVPSDDRRGDFGSFSMPPTPLGGPALVQTAPGTVTCERGTWDGAQPIAYAYAWARDGAALPGARAADFPATAREGLACTVTATNRAGTASATVSVPMPAPPPPGGDPPPAGAPPRLLTPAPPRTGRPGRVALPRRATVRRGVVLVRVRCTATVERCRGTLRLTMRVRGSGRGRARRARVVTIGSTRYSIAAGATATVRVRLTRAARTRLRAAPRRRLTVMLHAGGGRARQLVLRAAAPPRKRR